ncbi:MAG: peptidase E [Actinobacteria bacterium]|nr:peptidase E [Actinomycetota bacterium]
MTRHIVALGGGADDDEQMSRLLGYVAGVAGKPHPRICCLATAMGDSSEAIVRYYEAWAGHGDLSHVKFFPWPPANLREHVLSQDVVFVGGGNTANMLAIWRLHGFDQALREAWESGIVLTGGSAGMICWFEACVTDSFGRQLAGLPDGLGFLAGSACPHYDSEERRRPTYRQLVDEGFPAGIAADDGVALHYEGTELADIVSVRPGAQAYCVEPGSETPLEAREL